MLLWAYLIFQLFLEGSTSESHHWNFRLACKHAQLNTEWKRVSWILGNKQEACDWIDKIEALQRAVKAILCTGAYQVGAIQMAPYITCRCIQGFNTHA